MKKPQTNEEVAAIFQQHLGKEIERFERKGPGGNNGSLSGLQVHILLATHHHFSNRAVNVTCCADEVLKVCIEFTKPYLTQTKAK